MPKEDTTFYVVQPLDWFLRKNFKNSRALSQNYVKRSFIDSKEATNNVVSRSVNFSQGDRKNGLVKSMRFSGSRKGTRFRSPPSMSAPAQRLTLLEDRGTK